MVAVTSEACGHAGSLLRKAALRKLGYTLVVVLCLLLLAFQVLNGIYLGD